MSKTKDILSKGKTLIFTSFYNKENVNIDEQVTIGEEVIEIKSLESKLTFYAEHQMLICNISNGKKILEVLDYLKLNPMYVLTLNINRDLFYGEPFKGARTMFYYKKKNGKITSNRLTFGDLFTEIDKYGFNKEKASKLKPTKAIKNDYHYDENFKDFVTDGEFKEFVYNMYTFWNESFKNIKERGFKGID